SSTRSPRSCQRRPRPATSATAKSSFIQSRRLFGFAQASATRAPCRRKGGLTVKRLTLALAALLVLGATTLVATAQQPAPPAATTAAPDASAARASAPAAPGPCKIDKGDTAWMLTSSVLVLMMTAPGLALFYGGMVRQKNALGTLMHSFIIAALISVQWVLWGYSLAFGPDKGGIIGGLERV